MATKREQKPASTAGFFEKNFLKLKEGKLWEYITSRIITFIIGVTLGLLFIRDAAYIHSPTGISHGIIFIVAIIYFMNGVRKMAWGLVKMNDAAWDSSVAEKPHQRGESYWQRFFLRFPAGQRRHLINRQVLAFEALAAAFLVLYFVSSAIKDNLFLLSWDFPFILNTQLFSWSSWQVPVNYWEGLLVGSGAVIMSLLNNSLFLTKIPQVRSVLAETLKGIPGTERHLAVYLPMQLFSAIWGGDRRKKGRLVDKDEAFGVARDVLDAYPEHVISTEHKALLLPELVEVISAEHDYNALLSFLRKRFAELKLLEDVKPK